MTPEEILFMEFGRISFDLAMARRQIMELQQHLEAVQERAGAGPQETSSADRK